MNTWRALSHGLVGVVVIYIPCKLIIFDAGDWSSETSDEDWWGAYIAEIHDVLSFSHKPPLHVRDATSDVTMSEVERLCFQA